MNKTSKILVTGGTGLIGSYLIRKLIAKGFENISVIKKANDYTHLVDTVSGKVKWCEADVRNMVSMHDYFEGVDTVINCAGVISFWAQEFREMYDVNVVGTEHVVNLCLQHNVKQLIHLSSIEALGKNEDDSDITEQTEYKEEMQHTQYANTKYLGELEVWRGKAEGLNTVIYNPALVIGTGYWDSGPMKLITDIYNGLDYYPKGSIALVDVRDLVEVIVSNLDNKSIQGERIIVGSYNKDFKNFMDAIADKLQVNKPSKTLSGTTAKLAIALEKLKSLFTQSKPLINKETYLVTNQKLNYSFEKLHDKITFSPRSFNQTIHDVCTTFLSSYPEGKKFGLLPLS